MKKLLFLLLPLFSALAVDSRSVTYDSATKIVAPSGLTFTNISTPSAPTTGNAVVNKTYVDSVGGTNFAMATNAPIQVSTIAALRAAPSVTNSGQVVLLAGYTAEGDGGGGTLYYDAADTISADNGFSVIVSTSGGRRYKRAIDRTVTPMMFGAAGNNTGDDSAALLRAILWCKTNGYVLDGLGRTYRLTNSIGTRASLNNLATDGYGGGMTMRNINFLQATANTPILVWDLSTSTNLSGGDGGWGFHNLSFNWATKPEPDHTNSVAFYMAAPALVDPVRDYAFIYNSSLSELTFSQGHTGFLIRGKGNFWGNKLRNIGWYQGWSGPGVDFSQMVTYQASAPGNTFDGIYGRVDGFTSTSQYAFLDLGAQSECSIRNVEFNQGPSGIKEYIRISEPRGVSIRTVRLESGVWSPSYQGFISLINPQVGISVEDVAFYNVNITGNGFFVRFPVAGPATDTALKRFVFDTCRLTNANLFGVAGAGNSGEITPVQSLNSTLAASTWGHIFGDGTGLTWGVNRASRLWTSSDRGDASVTLVAGTDAGVQRFNTTLTANRTVTLSTTGAANGDEFTVMRSGAGAFTLNVGGVYTFAASQTGTARVRFVQDGAYGGAWTLVSSSASISAANTGTFGSATQTPQISIASNGTVTTATNVTVTPAVGSITGLGTGAATLLAGASSGTGGIAGTTAPTFLTSVQIGNGTGNPLLYFNGQSGSVRGYDIYSNGSPRWRVATSGAESGSNAGADILFQSFDDSGASLSFPFRINRVGSISLRAPAAGSAGTYFPAWTSDPASTTTTFVNRTAAQVRSDIGAGTGNGTVTSVAATVPAFLSVSGSPVTSSGTLAISYSGTALPVANGGTGITAFGSGIGTWLGTPSSANLAAALTDETGINGGFVRADGATVTNMVIGVAGSAQKVAGYDSSGNLSFFNISKTVAEYINTLTGNAQTQLDGKEPTITTLTATKGGTAQSTYATGDTLYASAANTLSKRAIGTSGQVLTVSGGVPVWATPAAASGITNLTTDTTYYVSGQDPALYSIVLEPPGSIGGLRTQVLPDKSGDVQVDDGVNGLTISALKVDSNGVKINRIRHGLATLVGGTVTVSDSYVSSSTRILLTSQGGGTTPGILRVNTRTAATSFTITSSVGTDTDVVAWMAVEP